MGDKLLAILRCPDDGSELYPAAPALVDRLNAAIGTGRLRNRSGSRIEQPINGGFIRAAGDLLYPIVDQIPVMLYDEAIPLQQLESS